MRFSRLVQLIGAGLLEQIPIMGPILGSILKEQDKERLEDLLNEILEQVAKSRKEPEGEMKAIISALHLAQAEVSNKLEKIASPHRRFLYLAGRHYAGPERTQEIAEKHGFLWRSYHKNNGHRIGKVQQIQVGDIIALAYRVEGNQFRMLLPMVVTHGNENTTAIDTGDDCSPFVWANDQLSDALSLDYTIDPVFKRFTGLPVRPLLTDVTAPIFQSEFPSPGNDSLWPHDFEQTARVPPEVKEWIASIGS